MPAPFKASVITPEAIMLDTAVVSAQVPVVDGLVGILHGRAPLLARLGTGVLRLDTEGAAAGTQRYFVSGGYAQMKGEQLTILTDEAIPAARITPEQIAAERAKLQAITGADKHDMELRQKIQDRISAMTGLAAQK